MRWNETNRNLVYAMMNMYRHAQTLKKNLSAQALKGISLDITNNSALVQFCLVFISGQPRGRQYCLISHLEL